MLHNVGTIDRILRVLLGSALLAFALGLIFPRTGYNWLGWIGVMPIATALLRTCPAYTILGLSTRMGGES